MSFFIDRRLIGRPKREERTMLENSQAFSGFAVDDLEQAQRFYGETLGLNVELLDEEHGLLSLHLAGDRDVLAYLSPDMTPPSYTILNFPVDDIDAAVDWLAQGGGGPAA